MFYVYILTNANENVFYTGMTRNLEGRIFQHKNNDKEDSFVVKYNVKKLVYYEEYTLCTQAIHREKQLKKYRRQWKRNLIESLNPLYCDLAESWYKS